MASTNPGTKQTAQVVVVNNTAKAIKGGFVSHRYSDVYNNAWDFKQLDPSKQSDPANVNYNTGFGRIGADWWLLVFEIDGVDYCTLPNAGTAFVTFLETGAVNYGGALIATITAALSTPLGGAIAGAVSDPIIKAFLNTADMTAYKQNTLTDADAGKVVQLKISEDKTGMYVDITSPSGTTRTQCTRFCKYANVTVRNETGQPLDHVFVWHKYGNIFKEQKMVPKLDSVDPKNPNAHSVSKSFRVSFISGKGDDWWIVGFKMGGKTYVSVPNSTSTFAQDIARFSLVIAGGVSAAVGGDAGSVMSQVFDAYSETLVSGDTSNAGYQMHTLKPEQDEDILVPSPVTTIVIKPGNLLDLKSPSHTTSCKYQELPPAPLQSVVHVARPLSMSMSAPVLLTAVPPMKEKEPGNIQAIYTCLFSCDQGSTKVLLCKRNERSFWYACPKSTQGKTIVHNDAESRFSFAIHENGDEIAYGRSRLSLIGGLYSSHDTSTGPQQTRGQLEFFQQAGISAPKTQTQYVIVHDTVNKSFVGVNYVRTDENNLNLLASKISGSIVAAKDIISSCKGNLSSFSRDFVAKLPPVYSNILDSVKVYTVGEAIAYLSADGHSRSVLQVSLFYETLSLHIHSELFCRL
jgi:hypothetical protein